MEPSNLADCAYYLITRLSLSLTGALRKGFAEAGYSDVRPAYLGVLMALWMDDGMGNMLGKFGREEGVTLAELGRYAGLEPSSMTGLVDRMEKDGLVTRALDPADRRASIVRLTDRGVRIRKRVLAVVDETVRRVFAGVPEKRLESAKEVLRTALNNTHRGAGDA